MPLFRRSPALLVVRSVVSAAAVAAQERGAFIIRLGRDTAAIETFTRTATRIDEDVVVHAPRVAFRRYVTMLGANGAVSRLFATNWRPGDPVTAAPGMRGAHAFLGDSIMSEVRRDTAVRAQTIHLGRDVVPMVPPYSWQWLEVAIGRALRERRDSVRLSAWYVGGAAEDSSILDIRKIGRDSVMIRNRYDTWVAHIDATGCILGLRPVVGTQQFSVERITNADLAAIAAAWTASERAGGAMGPLSVRDTVSVNAGGASLWIDYGRPSKRGRAIFGQLVPFGEVWRTGANAATQFRTDRALELGGVTVPAGSYTLWTVPAPTGWKLIFNSETGQWGTEHKPDRDVYTVDLATTVLSQPVERFTMSIVASGQGGTLSLEWDTTRAAIPFTVRQ